MSLTVMKRIAALLVLLAAWTLPGYSQRWEMLGTAHVDGKGDHDNITVGIKDGRFRAVALRVRGGAIEFSRVVIHYGNGEPEEVWVRERIPAGGQTRAIDLRGRDRFIRSVELWYSPGGWNRRPEIQLFGMR